MFSFYRKDCDEIALKYNCKIKFSISSYTVVQFGESDKDKFGKCLDSLKELLNSIQIEEVKLFLDSK